MTDERPVEDMNIFDLVNGQTKKIGDLLDYNQAVVRVCRQQAENWRGVSRGYVEMAQMASDIADDCALFARISIDRVGDIVSTEYDLTNTNGEQEEAGEEESD